MKKNGWKMICCLCAAAALACLSACSNPASTTESTGSPHLVVTGPVTIGNSIVSMPYASGDRYGFGTVTYPKSVSVTFTIRNTGTLPLTLSGPSPYVTISADSDNSACLSQLSIPTPPKQTIPAGESTKCVIQLAGVSWAAIGERPYTAAAKISSNDPDEPDFTLSLTGNIGC